MAGYSYPDKPRTPSTSEPREHRCGKCFGPYGKSAVRCPNEPMTLAEQVASMTAQLAAFKARQKRHTAALAAQSEFYRDNEREDARGES